MKKLTSGFHETSLTSNRMNKTLPVFIVLYVLGDFISSILYYNDVIPNRNWLILCSLLLSETIPLILVLGYIQSKKLGEKFNPKKYIVNIGWQVKHWIKIFILDTKRKWLSIIVLAIMSYVLILVVETMMFAIYPGQNLLQNNISTNNNGSWIKIIAPIFLAPVFEELLYRKLLPSVLTNIFSSAINYKIARFLAIIFAALFFVGQHDLQLIPLAVGYFANALFLQKIADNSNSLTAPILVHALYNILNLVLVIH
ncbi:CPBP family intramembrane metalloprotease [Apilactobacillus timberlakei]|uniref:CPBP family intramembrane glutamic endopeptidase n=1 Tax=Apilactobacillus timberlakei TaxID=2008380 RepID=UPI00112BCC75|nr:CPBP family intramembrane glutamic endopeptidase [Apilactobacillus timberlakei]TPR14981.1 CPBP family intramembrane metalloprotease [Apilactobacillus timberlakei]